MLRQWASRTYYGHHCSIRWLRGSASSVQNSQPSTVTGGGGQPSGQQPPRKKVSIQEVARARPYAYPRYTQAQKWWFWKGLTEHQGAVWPRDDPSLAPDEEKWKRQPGVEGVDPDSEPFRQIYADNTDKDDDGTFSKAEVISDPSVWFWVQRVLPRKELPDIPTSDLRERKPSGWIPPPKTPPNKTYFVPRTRGGLLPVYKKLVHREKYYLLRLDEPFPDMKPDVVTLIRKVQGNPRDLERELHSYITERNPEEYKKKKLLSAVSELGGHITFRGDHVGEIVKFLEDTGF